MNFGSSDVILSTSAIQNATFDIEIFKEDGIGVEFPMVIGNPNIALTI